MIRHTAITNNELRKQIKNGRIRFAGHRTLLIYGGLSCASGKRMKKDNRVFFASAEEAELLAFRPCGHCMRKEYTKWKMNLPAAGG